MSKKSFLTNLLLGFLSLITVLFLGIYLSNFSAFSQAGNNLIGVWNFAIDGDENINKIQISRKAGQLIGRYLSPSSNSSTFEIKVYSSGRGRPVISMAQIGNSYRAVYSGRLDTNTSINGHSVDVDNNQYSFTMDK